MRFPLATTALAVAGGVALGFACGSAAKPQPRPTRPAVKPAPGTGMLARAGRGDGWIFGGDHSPDSYGGPGYGAPPYGARGYGTGPDAGTTYGGYQFDAGAVRRRDRSAAARYRDYSPRGVGVHGTIDGRVRWPRPPTALDRLPAGGGCAGANPTLRVDRDGRVAGAVVYLADISAGRGYFGNEMDAPYSRTTLSVGGSLERDACGFTPYVQLAAPLGTELVIGARAGGGACELRGTLRAGSSEDGEQFRARLAGAGARARVDLVTPGPVEVTCDGGGTSAWVFVQRHPYHVLTDDAGHFRLGQVPPGSYRITAWHPPVLLGIDADGKLRYGAAVVAHGQVTVRPDKTAAVDLTFK
jgi:hypothetical protein